MRIEKQLKAIKKLAKKFYDKNPVHFGAVIEEIDVTLNEMRIDSLAYIETLECVEPDFVDMRELA